MSRASLGVVLAFVLLAGAAAAQSTVTVSGTITDGTGAVVIGATVDAVVVERAVARSITAEDGRYSLQVPAGVPFQLRVRSEGFADAVIGVPAASGAVTRDIALQIGGVSDTVVVTASRGAENRASVTQSVSVLTSQNIAALGSPSLAEAIRFVPGLAVEGTGREGALTSLFSRGGESDYNLVLVDGVRVNLDGGQFDFSRIAGGEIERVEVVRGAQSSLWGSDAMGAVVQVFTRRAGVNDAPRVTGSVEGGSFNTFRGETRLVGGALQRVDYQAGVTHRRTDGAFGDILSEKDRFEQTAFDAGLGGTLGSRASVRSNIRYSRSEGHDVGPITWGARDTGGVYDTNDFSWTTAVNHTIGARFTGTANINYFRYSNESSDTIADPPYSTYAILTGTPNVLFPNGTRLVRLIDADEFDALVAAGATPGPGQFLGSRTGNDFPFTSERQFRRPALRYQGDVAWAAGQRLSLGYEWERESNPLADIALQNNAFFVQQHFGIQDRWFVTVGARGDSKESYDSFFSPKLSAGGFLLPFQSGGVSSVKIFGNIGRGIKSPTFSERFGGSFADPAPDLKVEEARTADIGIEATFADQYVRTGVTYFDNDYTNQIAFRPGVAGDGIPEFINIDGSEAHGWELELALQRPVAGFTASGSYSLVDTRVVTNINTSQQFQPGQPLLRRPKHSGSLQAAYSVNRVTVDFNARFIGDRHDNSFISLRTVQNATMPSAITTDITVNPGYTLMGLGLSVAAHEALSVFLRVDNLADRTWDSALGYPALPRAVVVGARFNVGAR